MLSFKNIFLVRNSVISCFIFHTLPGAVTITKVQKGLWCCIKYYYCVSNISQKIRYCYLDDYRQIFFCLFKDERTKETDISSDVYSRKWIITFFYRIYFHLKLCQFKFVFLHFTCNAHICEHLCKWDVETNPYMQICESHTESGLRFQAKLLSHILDNWPYRRFRSLRKSFPDVWEKIFRASTAASGKHRLTFQTKYNIGAVRGHATNPLLFYIVFRTPLLYGSIEPTNRNKIAPRVWDLDGETLQITDNS